MDDQLRRQSVGAPAARSTLLTLLGEFVAPRGTRVPRAALMAGLKAMGYRDGAARQAVARSVDAGWIEVSETDGRSDLAIMAPTLEMLRTGYPRIFGFGDSWGWDGRWFLLVVRVPERQREVRDRLRTQLAWAGFGSLGGGLWITPRAGREDEARAAVGEAEGVETLGFSAEGVAGFADAGAIVAQAWDLPAISAQYREFVAGFGSVSPDSDVEVFRAQTSMVHAWRKFPFLDPELPDELLPSDWPRDEARDLFRSRHGAWRATAERYFDSLSG